MVRVDSSDAPGQPAPDWTTANGLEPWLWSDPPPPDAEPEPPHWLDPDDPGLPGAPPPVPPPPRWRLPLNVELQVVISAATLLGLDREPGLLRGVGAVPAEVVDELVADAGAAGARGAVRRMLCDPIDGRLVGMDKSTRTFTGTLRRFVQARDQRCRLSGGRNADIDHIRPAIDGGPTSADNAQGLGRRWHTCRHASGIQPRADAAQRGDGLDHLRANAPDVEWRLPTGRTFRRQPPPALGTGSRPTPERDDPRIRERRPASGRGG